MTLNLTQDDVGKVYVDRDGDRYTLVAVLEDALPNNRAVFISHRKMVETRYLDGKRYRDEDSFFDIIAEYKEPEVYEGWFSLFRENGKLFLCSSRYNTKEEALKDNKNESDFVDAIYIKHTIGEKR